MTTRISPPQPIRVGPFTEEDLDDQDSVTTPQLVQGDIPHLASQPLRQLSQGEINSKSPRRSISFEKGPPQPASVQSTDMKEPSSASSNNNRMNEQIAALLAQKKQRSNSAAPEEEMDASTKRRKGKLGRAISGSSNGLSRNDSTDIVAFVPSYEHEPKAAQAPPVPSQKVLYETEEREEKAKLIARLGGKVMDPTEYDPTVVMKSIGTVKELMVGDSSGLRRRGKRRC